MDWSSDVFSSYLKRPHVCHPLNVVEKSDWIAGSARLTTEPSMNARLEPRIAATSTHGLSRCGHDPRCAASCTCSPPPARAGESVSGLDTSGQGGGGRLLFPRA